MFDKIALAVLGTVLVLGFWIYRRAAARKQADAVALGGILFQIAAYFLFYLGDVIDSPQVHIFISIAAFASAGVGFRIMWRHGKAQRAQVEEEYQRFLEKRKNQTAKQTPR